MAPTTTPWPHKHLLGLAELNSQEIRHILKRARDLASISRRDQPKSDALRNKVVVNLFFEASTRTRCSFTLAGQRLGADVLDFTSSTSSQTKGESLIDTGRTIEAMGVDIVVCRHNASGAVHRLSQYLDCALINAGDGSHEHPSQGLLDLFTLCEKLERSDTFDLSGITMVYVGDIVHSRVARSGIIGMQKLGAKVLLVGPPTLVPKTFESMGCEVHHDLDAILDRVDAINMLRVQFERKSGRAFPSANEYRQMYGLTAQRMNAMRAKAVVMHPGPLNRGVEIDSEVADGPNSVVLKQVFHGVTIRMACLSLVHEAMSV